MTYRRYRTKDGDLEIGGDSYTEIAERLRASSKSDSENLAEFMAEVAGRMVVATPNCWVRHDTAANFISDLAAAGFLKRTAGQ